MATARLYCKQARRWNYQDEVFDSFNTSFNTYTNLGFLGQLPEVSGYTAGIVMFTFDDVPAGATITAATLNYKVVRFSGTYSVNVRLRVSSTYEAYTTSAPSGYQQTSISVTPTLTSKTLNIASQMQSYAVAGAPVYLYMYAPDVASGDLPARNCLQGIVDSTPYIDITYTTGSTVGRYNGSTFENCEVYRFNGTTWELCDIFRYDGAQFVECSTT